MTDEGRNACGLGLRWLRRGGVARRVGVVGVVGRFGVVVCMAALALGVLACSARCPAGEPDRAAGDVDRPPNILFIYLDDFGWRDAGFLGSDYYETPRLDRLAAEGMRFTDAYSCAANCAPARACLLSGQYTPRHEIYNVGTTRRGNRKFGSLAHVPGTDRLREEIRTWADCIRDAGYRTASMGKWHLSDDPCRHGFDINIGGSHSGSPPRGYFPPHPGAPGLDDAPEDEYLTDRLHDEAIDFVEAHRDRPWLLYLTHFAVHTPLQAQPERVAKYERKPAGELHRSAVMAAMIESVDEGVGRLLDRIDALGLREHTAVILGSDNGGYGPATSMAPLKGYKGTYYEGGIRVPMVVRWPGVVEAGSECRVPVTGVDLFPTLCRIAGAQLPEGQPLDGEDLTSLLRGESGWPDRALHWHFPAYLQSYSRTDGQRDPLFRSRPCGVIRHGDWKLIEYFEDGDVELFLLSEDIGETRNLASREPEKAEALREEMRRWRRRLSAPVPRAANPRHDPEAERMAIGEAAR